jgi:hypothetical protein
LNYTYHKRVELWYSTDGWQTLQIKPLLFQSCGERVGQALYVPGPNEHNVGYEYWEVNLDFEVGSQDVEYVVKYESSYGVYWANNDGMNLKLRKICEPDGCGDVNAAETNNAGVRRVAKQDSAKNQDEGAQLNLVADDMIHKIAHKGLLRDVLHELIDAKPTLNELVLDFACEADDCGDVNAAGTCNAGVRSVAKHDSGKNEDEDTQLNRVVEHMIHKITHNALLRDVLNELIDAKLKLREVDLAFVLWLRHADL